MLLNAPFQRLRKLKSATRARKPRGTARGEKLTLKQLAVEVLFERPGGADALAILNSIKEKYGFDVARESMSPQLSRLGQDGVISRNGLIWKIEDPDKALQIYKVPDEELPSGATPSASDEASLFDSSSPDVRRTPVTLEDLA